MKYVEKLNRDALFTVFLSIIITGYPIYLSGRKFKTNKGSHFSHIIKSHAKLNRGTHYYRMLWRSKVQKVPKGIEKFSWRIDPSKSTQHESPDETHNSGNAYNC